MTLKCNEYEWNFDETNGRLTCKRHGLEWRDETGDGAVLALLDVACELTAKLEGAKNTEQQVQPDNGMKTQCRWGKTERCEYRPLSCPDCTMPLQVN